MNESSDLFKYLFSFNTIHWVTIELNGEEHKFKYVPLSLKEKLGLFNKFENSEDNEGLLNAQCELMLTKAGYDISTIHESLSKVSVNLLYTTMLNDVVESRKKVESIYEANKTIPVEPGKDKGKSSKLDSLVKACLVSKELGISLSEISDLDEVSFSCLLMGMNELATREKNSYAELKNK